MNKYFKKAIVITSLAIVLTGCQAEVEPITADENTKVEIQNEEKVNVAEDLEKLIATGAEIEEIKIFIDDHIGDVDKDTADKMVYSLIELQKKGLEEEINYFYSESNLIIHEEIRKAYERDSSKFERAYVFSGNNKYFLVDNIEDKKIADDIKKLFEKGYGLYNAEGSYYPVIDYKVITDNYFENVTEMTAEYLDIMSKELDQPTIIEEYLAIDSSELKDRAFKYEEFLKKYPKSPYIEDVALNYMVCIWKLVSPNIFDGTLDENFRIVSEIDEVYKSILTDDSHPVTFEAVKGITEYIKSKNGVLGSMNNIDEIFKVSDKLHKKAAEKVEELYLSE